MFTLVLLVLAIAVGGLLVWKARQPDGTYNWKLGASGLLAIAVGLWEAFANGISGIIN